MDQESFESLVKSKMDAGGVKPPKNVWSGISSSLNDQAITSLQTSHAKYKWVAAAAVIIATVSVAFNIEFTKPEVRMTAGSYNALLPTEADHFRFYEATNEPVKPVQSRALWSNILFVKEKEQPMIVANNVPSETENFIVPANEVEKISPSVLHADVADGSVSRYYVAQNRVSNSKTDKNNERTFWAGVEAGAGSFNPSFTGTDPISANVNFDALASSLGQGSFVNPSSTATQQGMNEGVATSLGLDFGMKMGKRWALESGIQYTNVQSQSNAVLNVIDSYVINVSQAAPGSPESGEAVNRTTVVEENYDQSINLDNNIRFTSIPLMAGYYLVDNKLSLKLNAGLSANYFLASSLTDPTGQLSNADQTDVYNEWSFDGLTGFEFGYDISNNFNLTLEPNYRRSITPLSESLNTRSGFMIQTGLKYTIK